MEPDSGMTMYGPRTSTLRQYVFLLVSARLPTAATVFSALLRWWPADRQRSLTGRGLEQKKVRSSETACWTRQEGTH